MTSTILYDVKIILLLVLIGIPFIATENIDCAGRSFHCLNSTHFRICVDLGGGISTTVDDYIIPCPPPTLCSKDNRFECEFPQTAVSSTTAASATILRAVPNTLTSETNESESATTLAWEEIDVNTALPYNTSVGHLELQNYTTVSINESLLIDITTSASVIDSSKNETVTESIPIPNTTHKPQITTEDILLTATNLLNGTEIVIDGNENNTTIMSDTEVPIDTTETNVIYIIISNVTKNNIHKTTVIPEIEVTTMNTAKVNVRTLNVTNNNTEEITANLQIDASRASEGNTKKSNLTENNMNKTEVIPEIEVITSNTGEAIISTINVTNDNINEITSNAHIDASRVFTNASNVTEYNINETAVLPEKEGNTSNAAKVNIGASNDTNNNINIIMANPHKDATRAFADNNTKASYKTENNVNETVLEKEVAKTMLIGTNNTITSNNTENNMNKTEVIPEKEVITSNTGEANMSTTNVTNDNINEITSNPHANDSRVFEGNTKTSNVTEYNINETAVFPEKEVNTSNAAKADIGASNDTNNYINIKTANPHKDATRAFADNNTKASNVTKNNVNDTILEEEVAKTMSIGTNNTIKSNVTENNMNKTTTKPEAEVITTTVSEINNLNISDVTEDNSITKTDKPPTITKTAMNATSVSNITSSATGNRTGTSETPAPRTKTPKSPPKYGTASSNVTHMATDVHTTPKLTEITEMNYINTTVTEIEKYDNTSRFTGEKANQTSTNSVEIQRTDKNETLMSLIPLTKDLKTNIVTTISSVERNQARTADNTYDTIETTVKEFTTITPEAEQDILFNVNSLAEDTATSTSFLSTTTEANLHTIVLTTVRPIENRLNSENNTLLHSETHTDKNTTAQTVNGEERIKENMKKINVTTTITVPDTTPNIDVVTYNSNSDENISAAPTVQSVRTNAITTKSLDIVSNVDKNTTNNLNDPLYDDLTSATHPSTKTMPTVSHTDITNAINSNGVIVSTTFPKTINVITTRIVPATTQKIDVGTNNINLDEEILGETTVHSVRSNTISTASPHIVSNYTDKNATVHSNATVEDNLSLTTDPTVKTIHKVSNIDTINSINTNDVIISTEFPNFITTDNYRPHDNHYRSINNEITTASSVTEDTTKYKIEENTETFNRTALNNFSPVLDTNDINSTFSAKTRNTSVLSVDSTWSTTTDNIIRSQISTTEQSFINPSTKLRKDVTTLYPSTVSELFDNNTKLSNEITTENVIRQVPATRSKTIKIISLTNETFQDEATDMAISKLNTVVTINETATTYGKGTLSPFSTNPSDVTSSTDNYKEQITITNNDIPITTFSEHITDKTDATYLNKTNVLPTNTQVNTNVLQSNNTDNKITNDTASPNAEVENSTNLVSVTDHLINGVPSSEDLRTMIDIQDANTSRAMYNKAAGDIIDFATTTSKEHTTPQIGTVSPLFNETTAYVTTPQSILSVVQTSTRSKNVPASKEPFGSASESIILNSNLYNDKTFAFSDTPMSLTLAPVVTSVAPDVLTSTKTAETSTAVNNKIPETYSNNPTINSKIFRIPTTTRALTVLIHVNPDSIKTDFNFHSATPPTEADPSQTLSDNKVLAVRDATISNTSPTFMLSVGSNPVDRTSNTNSSLSNIAPGERSTESMYPDTRRPEESNFYVIQSTELDTVTARSSLVSNSSSTRDKLREGVLIPSMIASSPPNANVSPSDLQKAKHKEESPNIGARISNITKPLQNVVYNEQDASADQNLIMSTTVATTSWNEGKPISTATEPVTENYLSPPAVTNGNKFNSTVNTFPSSSYTPLGATNHQGSAHNNDDVFNQPEINLEHLPNTGISKLPAPISDTDLKTDNAEKLDSAVVDRTGASKIDRTSVKLDNNLTPHAVTTNNMFSGTVETFPLLPNTASDAIYGRERKLTINTRGVYTESEPSSEILTNTGILKLTVPISVTIQKPDTLKKVTSSGIDNISSSQQSETPNIKTTLKDINEILSLPAVTNNNPVTTVQTYPSMSNIESGGIYGHKDPSTINNYSVLNQSKPDLENLGILGISKEPVWIYDTNQETNSPVTGWSSPNNEAQNIGTTSNLDDNLKLLAVTNNGLNGTVESVPQFSYVHPSPINQQNQQSTLGNDGSIYQSEANFGSSISKSSQNFGLDNSVTDGIWSTQVNETPPNVNGNLALFAVTQTQDSSANNGYVQELTINSASVTDRSYTNPESLTNTGMLKLTVPITVTLQKANNAGKLDSSLKERTGNSQKSETPYIGNTSPSIGGRFSSSSFNNAVTGTAQSFPSWGNLDTGAIYGHEEISIDYRDGQVKQPDTEFVKLSSPNTGNSEVPVPTSDNIHKPDDIENADNSVVDRSWSSEKKYFGMTSPEGDVNSTVFAAYNPGVIYGQLDPISDTNKKTKNVDNVDSSVASKSPLTGTADTSPLSSNTDLGISDGLQEELPIDNDILINPSDTNSETSTNTGMTKVPVMTSDPNQKTDNAGKEDSSVTDVFWGSQNNEALPNVYDNLSPLAVTNNDKPKGTEETLPVLPKEASNANNGQGQESINIGNVISLAETGPDSLANTGISKVPDPTDANQEPDNDKKNETQSIQTSSTDIHDNFAPPTVSTYSNISVIVHPGSFYGQQGESTINNDGMMNKSKSGKSESKENLANLGILKVPVPVLDTTKKTDNLGKEDRNAINNFEADLIKNNFSNLGVSLHSTSSLTITTSNTTHNITETRFANSSFEIHRAASKTNTSDQPIADGHADSLPNSTLANTTLLDNNLSNAANNANRPEFIMNKENIIKDHVNVDPEGVGPSYVQNSSHPHPHICTDTETDNSTIGPMFSNTNAPTEVYVEQSQAPTEFSSIKSTEPEPTTGQLSLLATVKVDIANANVKSNPKFDCRNRRRGRYSDNKDCRKFYICIGIKEPIEGLCPINTVFSETKKQCTKNQSYCIRENKFQCVRNGRFSDFLENNVYFICVKNQRQEFVRFKFQCQSGYSLNKIRVRCVEDITEPPYQSTSYDSDATIEKKSSENHSSNYKVKKRRPSREKPKSKKFQCEEEGKFPDPKSCKRYYVCSKSNRSEEYRQRRKNCDSDEVFNKDKNKCVDADSFECS